jgi:hypothetical protein
MKLNGKMRRIGKRKWMMLGAYRPSVAMLEVDWN